MLPRALTLIRLETCSFLAQAALLGLTYRQRARRQRRASRLWSPEGQDRDPQGGEAVPLFEDLPVVASGQL